MWNVLVTALDRERTNDAMPAYDRIAEALATVTADALMAAACGFRAEGAACADPRLQAYAASHPPLNDTALGALNAPPDVRNLSTIPAAQWGAWAGPPRVTRVNATLGGSDTRVAAVWTFPDDAHTGAVAAHSEAMSWLLVSLVTAALQQVSDVFGTALVTEHSPATNGPLAWWQGGQAAQTRTRNGPDSTLGTRAAENPNGPDAGALPDTATDALGHVGGALGQAVTGAAKSLAIFAGIAIAGVVAWKWAGSSASPSRPERAPARREAPSEAAEPAARANPHKRRWRRQRGR